MSNLTVFKPQGLKAAPTTSKTNVQGFNASSTGGEIRFGYIRPTHTGFIVASALQGPAGDRFSEGELPMLNAVIINMAPAIGQVHYNRAYDPASKLPLYKDCWSDDGVAPNANVSSPHANSCDLCPMRAKGLTNMCGRYFNVVLILADDPERELFSLTLKTASLFKFSEAPVKVAKRNAKAAYGYDVDYRAFRGVKTNPGVLNTVPVGYELYDMVTSIAPNAEGPSCLFGLVDYNRNQELVDHINSLNVHEYQDMLQVNPYPFIPRGENEMQGQVIEAEPAVSSTPKPRNYAQSVATRVTAAIDAPQATARNVGAKSQGSGSEDIDYDFD
jgi:hypothetical protein